VIGIAASSLADIPPSPEQKKKIEETPRIMPKGTVTPLMDRPFSRTVGAGKAKVVIPRAVFDELVAAVNGKAGGEIAPGAKKGGSIPPLALVFAGLALSGACLYVIAKAPRFRTVAAASVIVVVSGGILLWSQNVEANAGPPRNPHLAREGQIILEVPSEGTEVVIYLPGSELKPGEAAKP
jgi:hypothetical protein